MVNKTRNGKFGRRNKAFYHIACQLSCVAYCVEEPKKLEPYREQVFRISNPI